MAALTISTLPSFNSPVHPSKPFARTHLPSSSTVHSPTPRRRRPFQLGIYRGSTRGVLVARCVGLAVAADRATSGDSSVDESAAGLAGDDGRLGRRKERPDVGALVLHLQNAASPEDVADALGDGCDLPLQVYCSTIKGLGARGRLDAAFAVVEFLKSGQDAGTDAPNVFIYNTLLSVIKQNGRYERASEVMEEMKSAGLSPNVVTYNTLMAIYVAQGRNDDALAVLGDIERIGLTPSIITCSIALSAYRNKGDAFGAIQFFVQCREKHDKGELNSDSSEDPNLPKFAKIEKLAVHTCYIVMRKWLVAEEDLTSNVLQLLSAMDMAGLRSQRMDYERLVWACTGEQHCAVAREFYRRIIESDERGEMRLSVANHLIWLMGKAKKWWAALEVYEELLDRGKPNNLSNELIVSHFGVLLNAARRRGLWRWGVRLLNKMIDKGLRPGNWEWNSVLVACSKASETTAALEIFKRMVDHGEKPDVLSYGALLSVLEKGKLYDEALAVNDHMRKVGVRPNLHFFTMLATVYISTGRPEMVESILGEMSESQIEPNVVLFNAIIAAFAKNATGAADAAVKWFHRMKAHNIKPNKITYEMLVKALAGDGKPKLAYEMYIRAYKEGLEMSARAYDAVVDACQAGDVGVELGALGRRPDEEKRKVRIRKNTTEFYRLADLPRRGKPFDRSEIYAASSANGGLE